MSHEDDFIEDGVTIDERLVMRKVFLETQDGRDVFKWMMFNLGLYRPVLDDRGAVLQNFAIKLLHVMGLTGQETLEQMIDYYKVIVDEDSLNPRKRNMLKESLDARRKNT